MATELTRLYWLLGAGLLLLTPLYAIAHIVMTVRDHRRHGSWTTTALALSWPMLCVGMAGSLQGNLSPPLFGIPLFVLFVTAWKEGRAFVLGVGAFYLIATAIVAASVLDGDRPHRGYLLLWPASLVVLTLWRKARIQEPGDGDTLEP